MSKTTVKDVNPAAFDKAIDKVLSESLDLIVGDVMTAVSVTTPVEDGHAHEAWMKATMGVNSGLKHKNGHSASAINNLSAFASGDPKAVEGGVGTVTKTKGTLKAKLRNHLGFVTILEDGGVISAGDENGNRGVKKTFDGKRNIRPGEKGPLYGPRTSGTGGMIFWTDKSGGNHFARSRNVSAGRHVERAIQQAKAKVASLGGKAK